MHCPKRVTRIRARDRDAPNERVASDIFTTGCEKRPTLRGVAASGRRRPRSSCQGAQPPDPPHRPERSILACLSGPSPAVAPRPMAAAPATNDMRINNIDIYTKATDTPGISRDLADAIGDELVLQSNGELQ